jgi:hypothetical protein
MDWALLRSCYHPGAIDEHGRYNGEVEGFIAWLQQELPRYAATFHQLGQQLIEIQGENASSETYGVAWHRSADGDVDRTVLVRYCDRFERRNGEWRIAHRTCVYEWVRMDPVSPGSTLPNAYRTGSRDRGDASYGT